MSDALQRTLVLALAIVALTSLAGIAVVTGHDPAGAVLNMVIAGLLGIAGAAAGAHAANGKGPTIVQPLNPVAPRTVVVGSDGKVRDEPEAVTAKP